MFITLHEDKRTTFDIKNMFSHAAKESIKKVNYIYEKICFQRTLRK